MSDIGQTPAGQTESSGEMSQDDRNLCVLIHVLAIFTYFVGPLVIWLLKKDQSREVARHGIEVLNFCITMTLAGVVCSLLAFIVIGLILLPLLGLYALINLILGAVAASKGEFRPYPFTLRLLS